MIPKQLKNCKFIKIKKNTGDPKTDKTPVESWKDPKNHYSYEEALKFSNKYNVGLICGSDNIRVIDIEGPEKGNIYFEELCNKLDKLKTFSVKTPSGGKHYYIWNEEEFSKTNFSMDRGEIHCGEYRVKGCYVLVPPSIVGGKKYE